MAERVRVQKVIAHAGLMSRRAAEDAIRDGRVRIDGRVAILGDRIDPDTERITLDGAPIPTAADLETFLLYKPLGVISTASDPDGRTTVLDLVPSENRLYPVGRLDADTEGLILVSNDGELTNRVTHPRFGITKTYLAEVRGRPTRATLKILAENVTLEDGPAHAESVRVVASHQSTTMVEIVMLEGRNREVRRMLSAVGHDVIRLARTAIGPIADRSLTPGSARRLKPDEIQRLLEPS